MAPRAVAVLFGLPGRLSKYNQCVTQVLSHTAHNDTYHVVTAAGTGVSVPAANVFLQAYVPRLFAAALADTPALEDLSTVRDGAHGRHVVATAPVRAGAVLKTRIVHIIMTPAEIAAVEARYEVFIKRELKVLMGLPADYEQEVVVQTEYSVMMPFMRKVFEASRHPDMQALMAFDPFADAFLTEEWDRAAAQDLLWLRFWLHEFEPELAAGELSPPEVWRIFAFTRSWAFPHATPEHSHGSLLFGVRLSTCQCPDKRWHDIVQVYKGTMTPDEAERQHDGVLLSTAMFHDVVVEHDTAFLRLFLLEDLVAGAPIVFDYGAGYGSPLAQTVNNLGDMPFLEQSCWFNVYLTIAAMVGPELARHLAQYLHRRMPALLMPSAAASLPRCANPACAKRLFQHRVCARCKAAKYCGRECQVAAWKTHKPECKPAAQ